MRDPDHKERDESRVFNETFDLSEVPGLCLHRWSFCWEIGQDRVFLGFIEKCHSFGVCGIADGSAFMFPFGHGGAIEDLQFGR